MKLARLVVGGIAIAAGAAAFLLFGRSPPTQIQQIVQAAPSIETEEVLVAARDILPGVIGDADVSFQAWPRASLSPFFVRKADGPKALEEIKGSFVRWSLLAGEPIRRDKIVKGGAGAGFLSAILPSGERAVAINIDSRGSTSAGGFILPNDHVDIINTYRDGEATKASGADVFASQVILSNIKVLAIGPNIQEKNGEKVVIGETATLELDPRQAQVVILAQRVGQLSLALRSLLDINQASPAAPPAAAPATPVAGDEDRAITVVRYGVAVQNSKK